jgi:glycosyltransferase involved in cell wall biosynthesis
MRIAYTVHKFPPESPGGTETYTWSLAHALATLGHEVHVFYPQSGLRPEEARIERDGIHLWRVPLPASRAREGAAAQYWHTFRDATIEAAFGQFLSDTRPDVVHFQHVQGVSARLIQMAAGRPRVATLHDYWYFCANSQLVRPDGQICAGPGGGWHCVGCATERADLQKLRALWPLVALPFAYRNFYLHEMANQIDLFLAPSEFLRQRYIRQGFPSARIQTLENGLDTSRLNDDGSVALPEPPGRPHFGFLGSVAWQKGMHVLIEAFNDLPEQAGLTIYGSEQAFPDYSAQLRAAARHPHIRFAGPLDYRHIGAALRQFDCLVVPSVWYENSPLVISEAYGVGLPIVASRLGAMAEKVHDGKTGLLFAPGDSADLARVLRSIIDRPEQLATFRKNICPGPSIETQGHQIVEIYERLAAQH